MINKLQIINQTSDWGPKRESIAHYSVDPEVHQVETQWSDSLIWKWELLLLLLNHVLLMSCVKHKNFISSLYIIWDFKII